MGSIRITFAPARSFAGTYAAGTPPDACTARRAGKHFRFFSCSGSRQPESLDPRGQR